MDMKDIDRRERLCRIYNETFNSIRPVSMTASHIRFSGIEHRRSPCGPHQVNAIAHIMYGGNTLLAHEVGAGKTFEMVAAAIGDETLGLCTNRDRGAESHHRTVGGGMAPAIPIRNILVATKKDFETQHRRNFCARIATGDL
jgi:N12 class adenine-specific DNA methylase